LSLMFYRTLSVWLAFSSLRNWCVIFCSFKLFLFPRDKMPTLCHVRLCVTNDNRTVTSCTFVFLESWN
jgi:hypothetical protein